MVAAVAIFILLSLGMIIFLYYQNQKLKDLLATYQATPSPIPTATADPTASWKTYVDTKYGFELKYPPTYSLGNYAGPSTPVLLNSKIEWQITDVSTALCKGDCAVVNSKEDVSVGDYQATKFSGWVGSIGGEIPQSYIKYEIQNPTTKKYFGITLWELDRTVAAQKEFSPTRTPGTITPENQTTFDQILSTFKFIQ
jgi:hypothetical protein